MKRLERKTYVCVCDNTILVGRQGMRLTREQTTPAQRPQPFSEREAPIYCEISSAGNADAIAQEELGQMRNMRDPTLLMGTWKKAWQMVVADKGFVWSIYLSVLCEPIKLDQIPDASAADAGHSYPLLRRVKF